MKFATRLVSFDSCPGDRFRAMATPIYQTATFEQEFADEFGPYDYSRSGNPTRSVLEEHLAQLDGAERSFCFNSGLAAIAAVTRLLSSGDEILAGNDLYGGTFRLFSKILDRTGIGVRYADPCDLDKFAAAITPATRLMYFETPTNPLLRVADVRAIAQLGKEKNILTCVDNSAMSPYLQRPLELGVDIALQSATKYLCGHSDVTAGVVSLRNRDLADKLYFIQNGEGSALAPFDSYLLLRGLKTLKLRLDGQQHNALAVAKYLAGHHWVQQVHFVGLSDHPGHHLHATQAEGPGALLSFETGSYELSKDIVESTQLFRISVSFGSVNSSISLPARMSHASIPESVRDQQSLPDDLIRLSIGIEDVDDLLGDLDNAFAVATAERDPETSRAGNRSCRSFTATSQTQ